MTAPASKADLMSQIDTTWNDFFQAVAGVDPARALEPGSDGWSVRDQVTHVNAWERSVLALLRGESRAEAVGISPEEYANAHIDEINARIQAASADLSLDEALSRANATHADLLAELNRLPWEDLHRPYSHFQPNSVLDEDAPAIGWVLGNTVEHYPEHQASVERTWGEVRQRQASAAN